MKIRNPKSRIHHRAGVALLLLALGSPTSAQRMKKVSAAKRPALTVVTVTPRNTSEVAGGIFTLGEIADFSGGDAELIRRLRAVEVGTSPLAGQSRSLFPGDIVVKLRACHLETTQVHLAAPPAMEIRRASVSLASAALVKAALDAAKPLLSELPDATLEAENPPQSLNLPTGKMTLLSGACKGRPENGLIFVPIAIAVDGKPFQTVEIALRAHRMARVVVANRQLEPGDILSADDVSLAKIDVILSGKRGLTLTKEAVGKRVKRRVLNDAALAANDLETPPAVLANTEITVQFFYGSVQVTALARTLQSGAVGDTIRVQMTDTRKELDVVITGSRTARLAEAETGEAAPAATE